MEYSLPAPGEFVKIKPAPVLPRLPQAEFEQLCASIAEHGILTPILLALDGTIIDGNERHRALVAIGGDLRKIPLRVFGKMTPAQRTEYAIRCNCERRHLTRAERQRLLLEYIRAAPDKSGREVGSTLGVDHRTASRAKSRLLATGAIDPVPTKGTNGKTYRPAASSVETTNHAGLVGKLLDNLQDGDIQGGASPRKLKKSAFDAQRAKYAEGVAKTTPSDYRLHLGDFRTFAAKIADNSIDVGLTDVPWETRFDHLLLPCFETYMRILRPGALLASYTSPAQMPKMIEAATAAGLKFWWQVICLNPESKAATQKQGWVRNLYRPVLIFSKPGARVLQSQRWVLDVLQHPKEVLSLHRWQQPISESVSILQGISRPGQRCFDACAGSGTTALACLQLGLTWVGCEIDPDTHRIASRRIHDALTARDRGERMMPKMATAKV
jgi:ParB-like chromosome segregation protein Spo0J